MTNPTEQRAREWWIIRRNEDLVACASPEEATAIYEGYQIIHHVIEYSAFQTLQAKVTELKKLNEYYQDYYLKPVREKVHADLADAREECEQLKAKHTELLSYMPKVPTEPYEKELARKLEKAIEALGEMKDKVRLREFANQKLEFEHVRLVGIIRKNELNKRKVLEAELAELRRSK